MADKPESQGALGDEGATPGAGAPNSLLFAPVEDGTQATQPYSPSPPAQSSPDAQPTLADIAASDRETVAGPPSRPK